MKYLLLLIFAIATAAVAFPQDSIVYRVIFIGDDHKTNAEQQKIFLHAAGEILEKKTTVFFLDENQYLQGQVSADSREGSAARRLLRLQYEPTRAKGGNVYSMSANHVWNKAGAGDSKKIDTDSLLKITPGEACPDPVEISIRSAFSLRVRPRDDPETDSEPPTRMPCWRCPLS